MDPQTFSSVLKEYKEGRISESDVISRLNAFVSDEAGEMLYDNLRGLRTGFPEVIYGAGKDPDKLLEITNRLAGKTTPLLITRIPVDPARRILKQHPEAHYNPKAKTLILGKPKQFHGTAGIVTAGTSDVPVAEEAAETIEAMGVAAKRINDVGVAGIHRLFHKLQDLQVCDVLVVVAGMEGALPSIVAGLVNLPVIACPTSIGYGANFQGLSALLTMINSCAAGISVVNIDNGFGAGYQAALIARKAGKK